MTEARSKKGQLTIVRSQKTGVQLSRPFFLLLASCFWLLASSAKLNEPRRIALPDRGSDVSACL
jgi:hypothetical protein